MTVRLLVPAAAELTEAVLYYNEQSEGLGYEFAAEIRQTLARIVENPEAWHPLTSRTPLPGTSISVWGGVPSAR